MHRTQTHSAPLVAANELLARSLAMPSSVIAQAHYHAKDRRLDVTFTTGRRYRYFDVPPRVAEDLRASRSKGEFFNAHIRDRYRFERND